MALFYLSCHSNCNDSEKNAGNKAVADIERLLSEMGARAINVYENNNVNHKIKRNFQNTKLYRDALKQIFQNEDDILIIQMPVVLHSIFLAFIINNLKKRGVRIIVLIHDINHVRLKMNCLRHFYMFLEEMSLYKQADALIVHNTTMLEFLKKKGIDAKKMVPLKIFDYLSDFHQDNFKCDKYNHIIIAGNLSTEKSGYIYRLPSNVQFWLYGANYNNRKLYDNVCYKGSYMPDELIKVIDGSFGLVWDGNSVNTCEGNYGNYMKLNNPHKTSLYLACGVPVIIWDQAALAPFIIENKVGITISNLNEIHFVLDKITNMEYDQMKKNAMQFSRKIRSGYFFKRAFSKCMEILSN